jgi:putative effector of murein hydrolase
MVLVGIIITIIAYMLSRKIAIITRISLLNPIFVSAVILIASIHFTPLSYKVYDTGGSVITKVLGPLVVILAVPLHKNREVLKRYYKPVTVGVVAGIVSSLVSVVILARVFAMDNAIMMSLIPKSITNPMAMELTDMVGGIKELTVIFVVVTGIIGATVCQMVFKIFSIENDTAKGIALGAASHGIGTAKAVDISDEAGAASSLSMGITGVVTILLAIITKFMLKILTVG